MNTTTQQTLNYAKELENIQKKTEFFKPPIGTSRIEFTEEASHITEEASQMTQDATKQTIRIPVCIGKENKLWVINVAGEGSLYAQILKVGAKNGNQLKGSVITLVTKTTGRTFNGYAVKDYTILEAQEE